MSFFPLVKKVASYQFKYVISHFIICHKQAPKFYCSKEPITETQKINTSTSGNFYFFYFSGFSYSIIMSNQNWK